MVSKTISRKIDIIKMLLLCVFVLIVGVGATFLGHQAKDVFAADSATITYFGQSTTTQTYSSGQITYYTPVKTGNRHVGWYRSFSNTKEISTVAELQSLRDGINNGTIDASNTKYVLIKDLDLSGINWVPIGTLDNFFTGMFDGNGHIISNLTITGSSSFERAGLFGCVDTAVVANLGMVNVNINYTSNTLGMAGAVVGFARTSTISNCYSTGSITITGSVEQYAAAGGIVGSSAYSRIYNCYNTASISANYNQVSNYGYSNAGGIASSCDYIENCFNLGSVSAYSYADDAKVGGIAYSAGEIVNCFNAGNLSATAPSGEVIIGIIESYLSNGYYLSGIKINGVAQTTSNSSLKAYNTKQELSACFKSNMKLGDIQGWSDGTNDYPCLIVPKAQYNIPFAVGGAKVYIDQPKDMKLGEIWESEYVVNFYSEGTEYNLVYGDEFTVPYVNEKVGYNFLGWKVEPQGFNAVTSPTSIVDISTASDLVAFQNLYNSYMYGDTIAVILNINANIDMSGVEWTPIGTAEYPFNGVVYGHGNEIYNLTMNNSAYSGCAGLFGYCKNIEVYDLALKDLNINLKLTTSNAIFGAFVAKASQTVNIERCYTTGNVSISTTQYGYIGGIVGFAEGCRYSSIRNCYNSANFDIKTVSPYSNDIGLICSGDVHEITNCFNTGNIVSARYTDTTYQTLSSCGYGGAITGNSYDQYISNVFTTGNINVDTWANSYPKDSIIASSNYNNHSIIRNAYFLSGIKSNATALTTNGSQAKVCATISDLVSNFKTLMGSDASYWTFNGTSLPTLNTSKAKSFFSQDYYGQNDVGMGGEKYKFRLTQSIDFIADFEAIEYKITYNENGGSDVSDLTYTIEKSVKLSAAPTKTGYSFVGWKLSTEIGNWTAKTYSASQNIGTGKYGDITLIAQWAETNYKITYDENGGSPVSDLTYTISTNITLANAPTKAGYTFAGWKLSTAVNNWSASTYSAGQAIGTGKYGNITLVAQWTAINYKITYDENGGSAVSDLNYTISTNITLANAPTKTGYTFAGWKLLTAVNNWSATTYSASQNIGTGKYGNITLAAQWAETNYKITYDENGGSAVNDLSYTMATDITLAGAPTKNGYTFAGWKLSTAVNNWSASTYTAGQAIGTGKYGNITLVAQWTETSYKITYDENGGSTVSDLSYTISTNITLATAPTKTGHTFAGWKLSTAVNNWSATTYSAGQAIGIGKYGNITLVAQWSVETYKITYDENGGSTVSDLTYTISTNITLAKAPTKAGHTFAGWKLSTAVNNWFASTYTAGQAIGTGKYGNITLVAQWTAINYKITYDENGGSTVSDLSYTISTNITLANAPTKAGYAFAGWKLSSAVENWEAKTYTASQNVGAGKRGDITLVAQWSEISYKITYVENGGTSVSDLSYTITTDITLAGAPTKSGYKFAGWKLSSAVENWEAKTYTASQNVGTGKRGDITLVAIWSENNYRITYDENGGSAVGDLAYNILSNVTLSAAPTRLGYEFKGWNLETSVGNWESKIYTASQNVGTGKHGDITLVAEWQIIEYTITYDEKGGTQVPDQIYTINDAITLADESSKVGYTFKGWVLTLEVGNWNVQIYTPLQQIPAGKYGNITLSALWEACSYTITYDENGGTETKDLTYTIETNITLSVAPQRPGYTFGGWKLSSAVANWTAKNYNASENIGIGKYGDITLVAIWNINNYKITYDENGGSEVQDLQYSIITNIMLSIAPQKIGYTFIGWKLETATANWVAKTYNELHNIGTGKYGNVTLVAQWETTDYIISYDENGGDEVEDLLYTITTNITLSDAPIRVGYTFAGWELATVVENWEAKTYTALQNMGTGKHGNITLVAQWTQIDYLIMYDENGGSEVADLQYNITSNVILANQPTKPGFTFVGWELVSTVANWEAKIYSESQNIGTGKYGNITLVALWSETAYKITYDENGGSEVSDLPYNVDDEITISVASTRVGYTFIAWKLETSSGNWVAGEYTALQNLGSGKYGNVTMVAVWETLEYTISYDENGGTEVDDDTYTIEDSIVLSEKSTLTGYVFAGWELKTANGNWVAGEYTALQNLGAGKHGNVTMVAMWEPIEYTISYEENGGTEVDDDTYTIEDIIVLSEKSTRIGYTFAGWELKTANGNWVAGEYSALQNLGSGKYGNITMIAMWETIEYTITYNENGGSEVQDCIYTIKDIITLSEKPTKTGYSFVCWELEETTGNWRTGEYAEKENIQAGKYGDIILVAQWHSIEYTIEYNENGGTEVDDDTYTIEDIIVLSEKSTRIGYTFDGWKLFDAVGNWESKTYDELQNIQEGKFGDITLVAQWTAIVYTITYDENGGSEVENTTYTIENSLSLSIASTKTGYEFKGWKLESPINNWTETIYEQSQDIVAGKYGDITLVAQWQAIEYKISYDENGGSEVEDCTYTIEDELSLAESPIKFGYTFKGWKLENATESWAQGLYEAQQIFEPGQYGIITLVAEWQTVQYSITYDTAGGSAVNKFVYTIEDTIVLAAAPTKVGFKFMGWQLSQSVGNWETSIYTEMQSIGDGKYGDITLVAVWKVQPFIITFETDGGTEVEQQEYEVSEQQQIITLPVAQKTGFIFMGWDIAQTSQNKSATINQEELVIPAQSSGNIDLIAEWESNEYTVTFIIQTKDNNNESLIGNPTIEVQSKKYKFGSTFGVLPIPSLNGYIFEGWYFDINYQTKIEPESKIEKATDFFVYAKWTIKTYTIVATADENAEISPEGEVVKNYGTSQKFVFNAKQGYKIKNILVDGIPLVDTNITEYQFNAISQDITISIETEAIVFNVIVEIVEKGNKTTHKEETIEYGQSFVMNLSEIANRIEKIFVNKTEVKYGDKLVIELVTENMLVEIVFKDDMIMIIIIVGVAICAILIAISIVIVKHKKHKKSKNKDGNGDEHVEVVEPVQQTNIQPEEEKIQQTNIEAKAGQKTNGELELEKIRAEIFKEKQISKQSTIPPKQPISNTKPIPPKPVQPMSQNSVENKKIAPMPPKPASAKSVPPVPTRQTASIQPTQPKTPPKPMPTKRPPPLPPKH